MQTVKIGQLEYLQSPDIAAAHCFTTRFGGVSKGILSSMNIGTHRGDEWKNVLKNYDILGSALGFDPKNLVLTHQTHTDIVVPVGEAQHGAGLFGPELSQCDGLVTNTPGMGLVVFTADCTPVIAFDPVTGAVGAAHAGWRGTAAGIAQKLIEAMAREYGAEPKNIRAAIGPNIRQCCFQTDWDVPQAMLNAVGEEARPFIEARNDKYYVNLTAINTLFLRRAGVEHIDCSTDCTCCQPDRFWSHRQVGGDRGSQGAIIVCPGREEK